MHVLRFVRVLLPLLVVAAVVAAVSSVLSARPDLENAKRQVDASWTALAPGLAGRYQSLTRAADALASVQGPVHEVVTQLDAALARWNDVQGHGSVTSQVSAANELEALGRRLVATAGASARVSADPAAKSALFAYIADNTLRTSATFNAKVAAYERERRGPVRSVVASLLGDGNIPALDAGTTA